MTEPTLVEPYLQALTYDKIMTEPTLVEPTLRSLPLRRDRAQGQVCSVTHQLFLVITMVSIEACLC